jgi:small conductance mechanosensitive channel
MFVGAQEDWRPEKLQAMELKLDELEANIVVLDQYSPDVVPGFEDLDKINQLVERLDFNKRKFQLLIDHYNVLEDEFLPYLLQLAKDKPELRTNIIAKIREYARKDKKDTKSILQVQNKINEVALLIERLEKQIERVQLLSRSKELEAAGKVKAGELGQQVSISDRIQKLKQDLTNLAQEIEEENVRLEELKKTEAERIAKVEEKSKEAKELKQKAKESRDYVVRLVDRILAQVLEVRLNGLERPRLNTTKTFVYLSDNKIKTLNDKVTSIKEDIKMLENLRRDMLWRQIGKGILVIFIAVALVLLLIRLSRRIAGKVLEKVEQSPDLDPHYKQRYVTLFSVVLSIIKVFLWILATLWVLGELEIDYAPFLVAAGGLSLAIGFGAQSLVKDFFSGFFMLMEEQLALGDVVDINGNVGTVEKISFRTIKLRSLDGTVHIIPNGNISSVSNLTHKWSRAVTKVGVSYDADAVQVLGILENICKDIYQDADWRSKFIDEPIAQGITNLGDSAVGFRILSKTIPGQQWAVDRELNFRIKKALDDAGVEIPYNYINIVNRTEK